MWCYVIWSVLNFSWFIIVLTVRPIGLTCQANSLFGCQAVLGCFLMGVPWMHVVPCGCLIQNKNNNLIPNQSYAIISNRYNSVMKNNKN